jgi:hypothetical protein
MIKLYGVWSIAFLATFQAGYAIAAMTAIKSVAILPSWRGADRQRYTHVPGIL